MVYFVECKSRHRKIVIERGLESTVGLVFWLAGDSQIGVLERLERINRPCCRPEIFHSLPRPILHDRFPSILRSHMSSSRNFASSRCGECWRSARSGSTIARRARQVNWRWKRAARA